MVGCSFISGFFYSLVKFKTTMEKILEFVQQAVLEWALFIDLFAVAILVGTKFLSNTTGTWFGVGCILLIIALGNASVMWNIDMNPTQFLPSLFGLAVLGALGVRFIGNWLLDGVK